MYVAAGLGVTGLVLAFFIDLFSPGSLWMAVLVNGGAALLLLAAGLQSARSVANWRARAMEVPARVEHDPSAPDMDADVDDSGWYERLLTRLSESSESLLRQIGL